MSTAPDMDQIHKSVVREWLHDRQIVIYTVQDTARETVDAWADAILELMQRWPKNKPYLAIYDVSNVIALTPYARKRTEAIAKIAATLDLDGHYAVVLKNNIFSLILKLFIQRDLSSQNHTFERQVFMSREQAIEWLVSIVDEKHGQ